MTVTPIAPTLLELLQLSLVPDGVYAPDPEQPDEFTWHDEDPPQRVLIMPIRETTPAKPSLRALVAGVDAIAETIEALDDDQMSPAMRDALSEQLVAALAGTKKKVDSTNAVLAMFEALESAAKLERDRLEKRAEYYARQTARLETFVLAVLEASKLDKIDGETSTLTRRKNPPAVQIDDATAIEQEFLKYAPAPPPTPDKAAIARALKAHRDVAGARLTQSVRLVRS